MQHDKQPAHAAAGNHPLARVAHARAPSRDGVRVGTAFGNVPRPPPPSRKETSRNQLIFVRRRFVDRFETRRTTLASARTQYSAFGMSFGSIDIARNPQRQLGENVCVIWQVRPSSWAATAWMLCLGRHASDNGGTWRGTCVKESELVGATS